MARVKVILKDDFLKAVDDEAAQTGMSRSALIQKALADYLEAQRAAREGEQGSAAAGRGL